MPTIELSIEDKGTAEAGDQLVSRIFTFADGRSRHMTYTARQGAHLDALLETRWTVPLFLSTAYDTAKERVDKGEATDFEDELRRCFAEAMKLAWFLHPSRSKLWSSDPTIPS